MRLRMPVDPSRDHILGPRNARVSLVEYADFECPYCGRAYVEVHDVLQRMRGQVQFVFRHFPLSQAHPHALLASEAAEAAGAQGKFWEMYSRLFENQEHLEDPDLLGYARDLKLDVRELQTAPASVMTSPAAYAAASTERRASSSTGIGTMHRGMPTRWWRRSLGRRATPTSGGSGDLDEALALSRGGSQRSQVHSRRARAHCASSDHGSYVSFGAT
jgi:hypothetical protein